MEFLPFFLLAILMIIKIPVAWSLMISSISYFLLVDTSLPVDMIFQRMISSAETFTFLAVPFFILAGEVMNCAGISRRMLGVADLLTHRLWGRMAQSNVVLSTLMGGACGSQNADAAMEAKLIGVEMMKRGYSGGYTCAITACSSTISTIIPPGIGLILYALYAQQSVGKMFFAGYLPGLLLCVGLMLSVSFIARRRNYEPPCKEPLSPKEVWHTCLEASWALAIPLIIILGIRFGFFTATEAGAVSAVYSTIVGLFIYKEITIQDIPRIVVEALRSTCSVMLLVIAVSTFSYYLSWEGIPNRLTEFVVGFCTNKYIFLFLINIFLLIVGMFLEGTASLTILTPLLYPIAESFGIDLIHFGLIMVLNISIGGSTPPFGTLMFVTTGILDVKFSEYVKDMWGPLLSMIIVLVLVTIFPFLSTFLPSLL